LQGGEIVRGTPPDEPWGGALMSAVYAFGP
jgi:hypothetical protein